MDILYLPLPESFFKIYDICMKSCWPFGGAKTKVFYKSSIFLYMYFFSTKLEILTINQKKSCHSLKDNFH